MKLGLRKMKLTQDAISSLINLLEGKITISNHQINKQRLLREISNYVHANASEIEVVQQNLIYQINKLVYKNDVSLNRQKCENNYSNIVNSKLERGVINFSRDGNIINILIQLSLLNAKNDKPVFIFKKKSQSLIEKDVETLLESSSFKGSISELESAQALSRLCFFLLNVDISDKHKITPIISTIISKFPPDDWFSSSTVIYGLSFLLRSLIPFPDISGLGSILDIKTSAAPFSIKNFVHGGVLESILHGSRFTYTLQSIGSFIAFLNAITSACSPPNRS